VSRPPKTPKAPTPDPAAADVPATEAPSADAPLGEALVEAPPRGPDAAPAQSATTGGASMMRSSLVYSGLTLVSRLVGFVRDLAISYTMGASGGIAADAWNTALAFPNLFRRLFAEGAFAAAFVPAYAKTLAAEGEEVADKLAADALATLLTVTVAICVAAQLSMPWLMYAIAPGFAANPDKFKLAVLLTQITMPYLPCMAIVAHLSGVLNARGRFVASAAAPIFLNLVTLVAVLPQHTAVGAATAASWGALVSGVCQAGLLWWSVRRAGAHVGVTWPRLTPEIKALIGLAIPGAVAASATQINLFISGVLASGVAGARSWLAVADRLNQLPLGLIGVAIGVALLPRLSKAIGAGDREDAQAAMDEAIAFSMALTLPAAAALFSMPYFLIDALFTRGEFLEVDARATAAVLFHYGWGTPAFVLTRILAPAFFARRDTKGPMRFALISVAVNIVLGVALFRIVGFQGIAVATSVAAWLNVFQMTIALRKRGDYRPSARALGRLVKIMIATLALGVVLAFASALRPVYEPILLRKEFAIAAVVALAVPFYFGLLILLRAVTPGELKAALRRGPKG
jgi:putative peptidoglycan lipid II flippase